MRAPKRKSKRRIWTSEEEQALEAGIRKHGAGNWKMILEDPEFRHSFGGRSNNDIKWHYNWWNKRKEILKKQRTGGNGTPKVKWTSAEREALIAGVNKHGAGKWKVILNDPEYSHRLAARSNVDLRNFYQYHHSGRKQTRNQKKRLRMRKRTPEEKEALIAGVNKHGAGKYGAGKWKHIQNDPEYSHCLAARSNKDLAGKWTSMILPETPADVGAIKEVLNKGAWTDTEDRILSDYIETHGEGGWSHLPTKAGLERSGKSCRIRWCHQLRPGIKRGNVSSGNRLSLWPPGRTANEIKNHWNTHLAQKIQDHSTSSSTLTSSSQSKEKERMVTGKSVETQTESRIVENRDKISDSTDHCKEKDLQFGNGFLKCPLGGRNLLQNYELDFNNGRCFFEFYQLCSSSGEKTDDYSSLISGDSSLFVDEMPTNWTGHDVLSEIQSLVTVPESEEDWLKE